MTNEEIRKEMEKLRKQGINPIDREAFDVLPYSAIGVTIETMIPESTTIQPFDFNIEVNNSRGAAIVLSNFGVEYVNDQKVLTFMASMQMPEGTEKYVERPSVVTSFSDFCWFHGNEKIDPKHTPETTTKVSANFNYGDIGWILPCRFADRLIDALGKVNDFLLEGILENALIYGACLNENALKEKNK